MLAINIACIDIVDTRLMAMWTVSTSLKYNIPLLFVLPVAVIHAFLSSAKSLMDFTMYHMDFTPPPQPYCHRGVKHYHLLTTNNGHSVKLKVK